LPRQHRRHEDGSLAWWKEVFTSGNRGINDNEGGKKEGEFLTANDANDARKWQDHHHAEKALLHQASETEGEAADAATSKTPSRTAPNSEVLKGRNISAQGKLGTSAALGSDPKDEFALKGQQQVTSTEGNERRSVGTGAGTGKGPLPNFLWKRVEKAGNWGKR